MRAAVYVRISDDREGRELGVSRQREDCLKLAERLGAEVVEIYQDNDIGASTRSRKVRPEYRRLLTEAERGRFGTVIAYTQSRLTRRPREHEDLIDLAERHGVRFQYVASPAFDLGTSAGRMIARMMAAKDASEAEDISERTRREIRQRAEQGEPHGGKRAFGYSADGRTLDEIEAPAVERAYRSLLAGRGLSGIATDLNAAGFRSTMAGRETTIGRGQRKGARQIASGEWKHNTVRRLLMNPRYAGIRSLDGAEFRAVWPAIVTEDVYRAAVALLGAPERRTNHTRPGARLWLGTGLYRCGREDCGASLVATYRVAHNRIYKCPECKLSRRADPVDEYVRAIVAERLSRPDLAALLAATDGTGELETMRLEASALRVKRTETLTLFQDGVLDGAELRETRAGIDARLLEIETRLADMGTNGALVALAGAPDPVAAWEAIPADQIDRQQMVVSALMTVRLLPARPGVRTFNPDTMAVEWRS